MRPSPSYGHLGRSTVRGAQEKRPTWKILPTPEKAKKPHEKAKKKGKS